MIDVIDWTDSFIRHLLSKIEQLPREVYNYKKIDLLRADLFTLKAVLLVFNLDGNKRECWIPFSHLRKDNNNEIWLSNWMLERIKSDGKNV